MRTHALRGLWCILLAACGGKSEAPVPVSLAPASSEAPAPAAAPALDGYDPAKFDTDRAETWPHSAGVGVQPKSGLIRPALTLLAGESGPPPHGP